MAEKLEAEQQWQHVKRGTTYDVIGVAELQNANTKGLREGASLAVYRGDDGKLWARAADEFTDGRFVLTTATPDRSDDAVKTVACALCIAEGDDPEREGPWDEWWEGAYGDLARAAIAAMPRSDDALAEENRRLRGKLQEIALEAHETIPPDGKEAAFGALDRITRLVIAALKGDGL